MNEHIKATQEQLDAQYFDDRANVDYRLLAIICIGLFSLATESGIAMALTFVVMAAGFWELRRDGKLTDW